MPIRDKGSNYQFYDHLEKARTPRSAFIKSFRHTTTIKDAGAIVPIALFETLPGDSWSLSVSALIRTLPTVVPLMSRQRLFIHAYYSRLPELWNEAETFMTKGYNGKTVIEAPVLNKYLTSLDGTRWGTNPVTHSGIFQDGDDTSTAVVEPGHLADYFGLPIGAKYDDLEAAGVSALPFMMYFRIYRDYYMNKNYYVNNRNYLPNDDGDLRLNSAGRVISVPDSSRTWLALTMLRYRDWTDDFFTSALPWPQRGEQASLTASVGSGLTGTLSGVAGITYDGLRSVVAGATVPVTTGSTRFTDVPLNGYSSSLISNLEAGNKPLIVDFDTQRRTSSVSIGGTANLGISADDFRALFINQAEMEKMARTDGSYTQFGLAFFGVASKASRNFKPTYIGGTYQPILYSEVVQTSQTTTGDSGSPLGSLGGKGISSFGDSLGNVYCDDYGFIMIVASIMPDTYYSQGLARMWTRRTQADMYLPERDKLGMQPILNKELYFSGNPELDDDVWAYQNRNDEYRYTPNRVSGKIADPNSLSFYPYTQARYFSSLPGYSQAFATTKKSVRNDYLTAPSEDNYIADFAIGARAVRPMPYKAIPAEII